MVLRSSLFGRLNPNLRGKIIYGNFDGVVREAKIICGRSKLERGKFHGETTIIPIKFYLYVDIAGLGKQWVIYANKKCGFLSTPILYDAIIKFYLTEEDATKEKAVNVLEEAPYKDVFRYLIGDEKLNEGSYAYKYSGSPSSYFRYRWNGNAPEEVKFDNAFGTFEDLTEDEGYMEFDFDGCRFACERYNEKLRAYFKSTYPTKEDCANNNKMQIVRFEEETKCENIDKFAVVKVTNWSLDDDLSTVKLGQFESEENAWECIREELFCEESEGIDRNDVEILDDGVSYSNDDGTYSFTIKIIKV